MARDKTSKSTKKAAKKSAAKSAGKKVAGARARKPKSVKRGTV